MSVYYYVLIVIAVKFEKSDMLLSVLSEVYIDLCIFYESMRRPSFDTGFSCLILRNEYSTGARGQFEF